MPDQQGSEEPSASAAEASTPFGFKMTLTSGTSETVTFRGDQGVLLSGISGRADGPAIVDAQVTDTKPEDQRSVSLIPSKLSYSTPGSPPRC